MSWLSGVLGAITASGQATAAVANALDQAPEVELAGYTRDVAEGYVRARQDALRLYAKAKAAGALGRQRQMDRLTKRAMVREAEAEGCWGALIQIGVPQDFRDRLEVAARLGVRG